MKRRNIILLISILLFASCKEITKNDIKGNWIVSHNGNDEAIFSEINFKEDKVELIDQNLFKELGVYQVKNGKIKIELERDDWVIETEIINLKADTLLIFDSLAYHRRKDKSSSNLEKYDLIGIPTNQFLSKELRHFDLIHLYKSDREVQIRFGDKKGTFGDIPLFLGGGHSTPKVLIFLGKGIHLKDLRRIYYYLAAVHQLSVWLGTKREGISDIHILEDKIEIFGDDLENHFAHSKMPLPPQPIDFTSKEVYLKNGGEEVKILDKNDFSKIDQLTKTGKYLISINTNLPIEDYFELKRRLAEKRKLNRQIMVFCPF